MLEVARIARQQPRHCNQTACSALSVVFRLSDSRRLSGLSNFQRSAAYRPGQARLLLGIMQTDSLSWPQRHRQTSALSLQHAPGNTPACPAACLYEISSSSFSGVRSLSVFGALRHLSCPGLICRLSVSAVM